MKLAGALAIVYVVWGSTYLGMAVADRTLPPLLMLSVRFLIAGALLYAWSRRAAASSRPSGPAGASGARRRSSARRSSSLDTGGVAWAVQRVPSGTAALLVASVPLFMAVIDRACFGIRLPLGAVAGIATGLARRRDPRRAVAATSTCSAPPCCSSRPSPGPRAPRTRASRRCRAARSRAPRCRCLRPARCSACSGSPIGEGGRVHPSQISAASLGALLFLIVFGSLVAFTAYGWLLQNASTPLLSTYAYVNPAVAVFLGWAFVGEHVGGREIAAGLVDPLLGRDARCSRAKRARADAAADRPSR